MHISQRHYGCKSFVLLFDLQRTLIPACQFLNLLKAETMSSSAALDRHEYAFLFLIFMTEVVYNP